MRQGCGFQAGLRPPRGVSWQFPGTLGGKFLISVHQMRARRHIEASGVQFPGGVAGKKNVSGQFPGTLLIHVHQMRARMRIAPAPARVGGTSA